MIVPEYNTPIWLSLTKLPTWYCITYQCFSTLSSDVLFIFPSPFSSQTKDGCMTGKSGGQTCDGCWAIRKWRLKFSIRTISNRNKDRQYCHFLPCHHDTMTPWHDVTTKGLQLIIITWGVYYAVIVEILHGTHGYWQWEMVVGQVQQCISTRAWKINNHIPQ